MSATVHVQQVERCDIFAGGIVAMMLLTYKFLQLIWDKKLPWVHLLDRLVGSREPWRSEHIAIQRDPQMN
jgi:hypothetical protein